MKYYWAYLFLFMGLIFPANLVSQEYHKSPVLKFPPKGPVKLSALQEDFDPVLERIEMPAPGGKGYQSKLKKIKDRIGPKKYAGHQSSNKGAPGSPQLLRNFQGNISKGIPNDNHLAVSNKGVILSVVNSNIYVFNDTGKAMKKVSLKKFSDTLGLKGDKYDPRVLYDPSSKKFVIAFLNGKVDSMSRIVLAFSQNEDPLGNWNLYALPGNPFNDSSWSDFPGIALTQKELILTVNLLHNDSSWQSGFKQTLIWQIDKFSGYRGDALNTRFYKDIKLNGKPLRNLCPVAGGSKLYGPEMYLLSNHNFAPSGDTFYVVELTGLMEESDTRLKMNMFRTDASYGVPPDAQQLFEHKLLTNDSRVLDAYIENGTIHFAGNTLHPDNNRATIYHGRITGLTKMDTGTLHLVTTGGLELGYPSIVYAGTKNTGDESIIIANHTSKDVNPGYSALYYSNGRYSSLVKVKEGETVVNAYGELSERWGDYTGLQRKYNEVGKVWSSGYFGRKKTNPPPGEKPSVNSTWIAELGIPPAAGLTEPVVATSQLKTYPNPAMNYLTVDFELEERAYLEFHILGAKGRHLQTLMEGIAKPGTNRFSFSLDPLSPGTYLLVVRNSQEAVLTRKFIKK